jgi:putative ABC transport system substrate-binding protein
VIYSLRYFVEIGGLMTYAFDLAEVYRHLANQIDKILKGSKPGELPFFLPTRYELVINVKAAKALGLELPPTLLARADEIIE